LDLPSNPHGKQTEELLDLIQRLAARLRVDTFDERPGESELWNEAEATLARYKPATALSI
jgi:hypothetical protein